MPMAIVIAHFIIISEFDCILFTLHVLSMLNQIKLGLTTNSDGLRIILVHVENVSQIIKGISMNGINLYAFIQVIDGQ